MVERSMRSTRRDRRESSRHSFWAASRSGSSCSSSCSRRWRCRPRRAAADAALRPGRPPSSAPVAAADPGSGITQLVDPDWAASTAAATGIPERALLAYAGAAIVKANAMPGCGLSWTTLAGDRRDRERPRPARRLGRSARTAPWPRRSSASRSTGSTPRRSPTATTARSTATPTFDRAVGPMQLIPQTWRNWHTDGNGDGVEDPQNIDDARHGDRELPVPGVDRTGHRGRMARRDLGLQLERHVPGVARPRSATRRPTRQAAG